MTKFYKHRNQTKGAVLSYDYLWCEEGSQPEGYEDAYNISDIHYYGKLGGADYDFVRKNIAIIVSQITGFNPANPSSYIYDNWVKLNPDGDDEQMKIASEHFVVPSTFRMMVNTEEEDKSNWDKIIVNSRNSRVGRLLIAKQYASYFLPKSDSDDLFNSVVTYFESYMEANTSELVSWLSNKLATPFENDGFAQKDYYDEELKNELIAIITDGKIQ